MKEKAYLNEPMKKIIRYLHEHSPSTPNEISNKKDKEGNPFPKNDRLSYVTVLKYLEILKSLGLVHFQFIVNEISLRLILLTSVSL